MAQRIPAAKIKQSPIKLIITTQWTRGSSPGISGLLVWNSQLYLVLGTIITLTKILWNYCSDLLMAAKNQDAVVWCQGAEARWRNAFWQRRQLLKKKKKFGPGRGAKRKRGGKLTGCGLHCQRLFINYQFNRRWRHDITKIWLKVLIDYEDHPRRMTKKCTKQLILFQCYQRSSDYFTSSEAKRISGFTVPPLGTVNTMAHN